MIPASHRLEIQRGFSLVLTSSTPSTYISCNSMIFIRIHFLVYVFSALSDGKIENNAPPLAQTATPPKQYATNRQMGVARPRLSPSTLETPWRTVSFWEFSAPIRNSQALGGQ